MMQVNKQSIGEILKAPHLLRKALAPRPPAAPDTPAAAPPGAGDRPASPPLGNASCARREPSEVDPNEALLQRVIDDVTRCVQVRSDKRGCG